MLNGKIKPRKEEKEAVFGLDSEHDNLEMLMKRTLLKNLGTGAKKGEGWLTRRPKESMLGLGTVSNKPGPNR